MKKLIFLVIGMFTVGSSSFMMAGLLPEIGQTLNQPISVTAQGITAFTLAYFFSAPLLSITLANRPPAQSLKLALVVFLLGNFITIFSTNISIFVLGRAIAGLGAGFFNPICVGTAMQMGNPEKKGRTLSFIWGANSAGVVFGVPLGVLISNQLNWQLAIGYTTLLGLIALVGFTLQNEKINLPQISSMKERLSLLVDKRVLAIIGVSSFTVVASTGLYSYISLVHTGSPHSLPTTLLAWAIGGFVGSSSVGFLIDRIKNAQYVMAFLLLGLILTFFTIPFFVTVPFLSLILFFLWGAFGWATVTPQQHALFELHENQKTLLSALNSSAISLGSTIGTAIGGAIIAAGSGGNKLSIMASIFLTGVLIYHLAIVYYLKKRGVNE